MAFLISAHKIVRFDSSIIGFVQGFESPVLTPMMEFFTFIGSAQVTVILSILILIFLYVVLKHRAELILFIALIVGSPIINSILKSIFHRARPDFHRLIEIGGYSFPSGHAMNACTVYGILTFLLWRHISKKGGRILLLIFNITMILMIGISRIYLGVHYPSDVISGYFASGFLLAMSIWFFQRYKDKRARRRQNLSG
ncbi:phosphatase PAP2 family protein [Pseudoneobacillus sp. C159]